MHSFVEKVAEIRGLVGDGPIIMAGNVCTPEMVQDLIVNGGADIVKIGIGPGSACTTRKITGVGFPQLSAIAECANVAHGLCREKGRVGLICADGGCKTSGDIAKAYGAGADFVMVGGMLAGTLESDGMWETEPMAGGNSLMKNPPPHVKRVRFTYYGMSSEDAQNKYSGGLAEYKSSEGKRITVPYKGPAVDVVKQIKGGLRSACSYVGATCLKDFNKCCTFVRVR
jgi:GMP reductase